MEKVYKFVVVDDDADDLFLLNMGLKEVHAQSGKPLEVQLIPRCLDLVEGKLESGPDVFIIDFRLALMTAPELIGHLRSQPAYQNSKILVWSSGISETDSPD